MSYVWTPEQVERYRSYYDDIRTHHTYSYVTFATTEAFVRSVLPPCLEPSAQPTVTVAVMAFMEWIGGVPNRAGRDRAASIAVGARYGDEEGVYYLTVIESEEVNIVTGRELWGMPKKEGSIDLFEDGEQLFAVVERKDHRLIELQAALGEPQHVGPEEETEIYFELRGHFGPNLKGLSNVQLVVFENRTLTKRLQALTVAHVGLTGSPFDPGVGTVPLGEQVDGAHLGGETSYIIRDVVDLDGDGNDYTPYLAGRLYDDWPDVRATDGRVIGSADAAVA
ncbi:MAG TPA: acetoacetate decarboxylase family protein [Baekduia sp.]|uniref:acetoacetate decarboxylase family protein n=1 Tax=Baekduia sp. TaxID=2600305 RepID=UPI002D79168B|nr:acetoacetate decarboxylase family protein [Baekduia sp.]HET6509107.1 acetoacetate decarboxylase family protein [Baekduia sp.]